MTELTYILLAFFASRIAVMIYDFLSWGEIFGFVKLWIARKVDPMRVDAFLEDIAEMPKSEAQIMSLEMYDFIAARSFFVSLIDCKFCLTIWVAVILAAAWPGLPWAGVVIVPIIGYLITEKL